MCLQYTTYSFPLIFYSAKQPFCQETILTILQGQGCERDPQVKCMCLLFYPAFSKANNFYPHKYFASHSTSSNFASTLWYLQYLSIPLTSHLHLKVQPYP